MFKCNPCRTDCASCVDGATCSKCTNGKVLKGSLCSVFCESN